MSRPPYFPAFLDLHGRACVVIGAGRVAKDKIAGLLEAGAKVTVIAPQAEPAVAALARSGALRWRERVYGAGDLDGAFLAIAATAQPQVNRQVQVDARARGCLVNVVDVPELCDYITPSVVRRGKLTIAMSTQGTAPAFAAVLRRYLDRLLGDEIADFLERATLWRGQLNRARLTPAEKRRWWYALLGRAAPQLLNASPRRAVAFLPAANARPAGEPQVARGTRDNAARGGSIRQLGLLTVDASPPDPEALAAVRARLAESDVVAAHLTSARTAGGQPVFEAFLLLAGGPCPGLLYHSPHPRLAKRAARAALGMDTLQSRATLHAGEQALQALYVMAGACSHEPGGLAAARGALRAGLDAAGLQGSLSPLLEAAAVSALACGRREAAAHGTPGTSSTRHRPAGSVPHDPMPDSASGAVLRQAARRFAQSWNAKQA